MGLVLGGELGRPQRLIEVRPSFGVTLRVAPGLSGKLWQRSESKCKNASIHAPHKYTQTSTNTLSHIQKDTGMSTRMSTCMSTRKHMDTNQHTHTPEYIGMRTQPHTATHKHMQTQSQVHMHMYIHTHAHTDINLRIHNHTCVHRPCICGRGGYLSARCSGLWRPMASTRRNRATSPFSGLAPV